MSSSAKTIMPGQIGDVNIGALAFREVFGFIGRRLDLRVLGALCLEGK
jgi:hypothetical protein